MKKMKNLLEKNRQQILALAAARGARNVRIFGSIARGEDGLKSDVDFLVDMDKGRSLLDMGGLLMDLQDLLGRDVDLVTEKMLHPFIRKKVVKESIPL